MQSAATRRVSARTTEIAASRVGPYAITPGMDSMSAHQRPSSSTPRTMGIDSGETVPSFHRSCSLLARLQTPRAGPCVVADRSPYPSQRRASFAPAAGFAVMTTGTTTTLSSYLTVILAFPAATPETPPSLVTAATVGRSEV